MSKRSKPDVVHDEPTPEPTPAPRPSLDATALAEIFSYHAPTETQTASYGHIREAAKTLAAVILKHTPRCADQAAAVRKVREAVFTANAAIALGGRV